MKKKFNIGATLRYQLTRSLTGDSTQASGTLASVLMIANMPDQELIIEICYLPSMKLTAICCLN